MGFKEFSLALQAGFSLISEARFHPNAASPAAQPLMQLRSVSDTLHGKYKKMPAEAIMSSAGLATNRFRLIETFSEVVWQPAAEVSAIGIDFAFGMPHIAIQSKIRCK